MPTFKLGGPNVELVVVGIPPVASFKFVFESDTINVLGEFPSVNVAMNENKRRTMYVDGKQIVINKDFLLCFVVVNFGDEFLCLLLFCSCFYGFRIRK